MQLFFHKVLRNYNSVNFTMYMYVQMFIQMFVQMFEEKSHTFFFHQEIHNQL